MASANSASARALRLSVPDRCSETREKPRARNGCTAWLSYCNAMLPTARGHAFATRKIFAPSIASKRNREAGRRKTFSQKISPRASKEPHPPSQTLESRPTDSPPRGTTPVPDVTRSRTIRTAATHQCGSRSRCSKRPRSSKPSDAGRPAHRSARRQSADVGRKPGRARRGNVRRSARRAVGVRGRASITASAAAHAMPASWLTSLLLKHARHSGKMRGAARE
jgi:hypothetical protein